MLEIGVILFNVDNAFNGLPLLLPNEYNEVEEFDFDERADKFVEELLLDENNDDVWNEDDDADFKIFGGD